MRHPDKYESFWQWFMEREPVYYNVPEATWEEVNALLERLQAVNPHFLFDLTYELVDGYREMFISADGVAEAFDDLHALLQAAPELERFQVIGLLEPMSEGAEIAEEENEYTELDLSFLPPTLQKLKAFDESLEAQGKSLDDGIGVRWTDARMAYQETPLDVLPFMDVGVDGIHVGLLTDFGQVTDLEEAFIVLVMPADPESGRFLARNPKEFVDFLCSDQYLTLLCNGLVIDSAETYQQVITDTDQDFAENPELENTWKAAAAELREAMDAEPIADVYGYVAEVVTAARESQIALPTLDGIGVVSTEDVGELPVFRLEEDVPVYLKEVKQFFATAPVASKQAFIRNAQYTRALFEEPELKAFIMDELEVMGCSAEAERLRSMDW